MQPISFTATSAEEAVAQIREQLGPEAIVLNVRPLPANGIARLWQKPMIEVLACLPEAPKPAVEPSPLIEALAEFRQELNELRQKVAVKKSDDGGLKIADGEDTLVLSSAATAVLSAQEIANESTNRGAQTVKSAVKAPTRVVWPTHSQTVRAFEESTATISSPVEPKKNNSLAATGMMPVYAEQISEEVRARHGNEEISNLKAVLAETWRQAADIEPRSLHVLVGPAGSGKTTCLCKWLTQAALVEGRQARVWRLDGATANMAESLSIYCDILGVPNERTWHREESAVKAPIQSIVSAESKGTSAQVMDLKTPPHYDFVHGEKDSASQSTVKADANPASSLNEDIGFIDLPGIDWRNPLAMKELKGLLKQLGNPQVHLVLNGAYESQILLAQARAFGALPIEDVIVTHLDEETRWGKLWNLALGTNYPIRSLSTGQNIPGDFCAATSEIIFSRQFPNKQRGF